MEIDVLKHFYITYSLMYHLLAQHVIGGIVWPSLLSSKLCGLTFVQKGTLYVILSFIWQTLYAVFMLENQDVVLTAGSDIQERGWSLPIFLLSLGVLAVTAYQFIQVLERIHFYFFIHLFCTPTSPQLTFSKNCMRDYRLHNVHSSRTNYALCIS